MKYSCSCNLNDKEIISGLMNYQNLQELLNIVSDGDKIYLLDKYYYGKFYIKTPNLTIVGLDELSTLDYDAYNGLVIRDCDGGDGKKTYGTTGSSSVTILKEASNITMKNLIIKNSFIRKKGIKGTQNVAFKTSAKGGKFSNIRFIGQQDTLYIDENDNYFKNCYIEGDVDFIFGAGDAVLEDCQIKLLQILDSNAYLCAPDTYYDNLYGFLFINCDITSVGTNLKYLGRAWYPGLALRRVEPKCMFMNCRFKDDINLKLITMHEGDPTNFVYYLSNCSQKGKIISNCDDSVVSSYLNYYQRIKVV